jgi:predicted amidohydrolase YtcJ
MSEPSETALVNGRILVHDATRSRLVQHPTATAMLIRDGRIVAIGEDRAIVADCRVGDEIINLSGGTVAPGFIDAHIHALHCAIGSLKVSLLPPAVDSFRELQRRLSARADTASPQAWVLGEGYDEMRMAERRHPSRSELDEAVPNYPTVVMRVCGHMAVANSKALQIAGIDQNTPDPSGGTIVRDPSGSPTGLLLERAQGLLTRHVPPTETSDIVSALHSIGARLTACGITTICEAHLGGSHPAEAAIWAEVLGSGWAGPMVTCLLDHRRDDTTPLEHVDVRGTKLFADGVVTGRTAAVSEPFEGSAEYGMLIHEPGRLTELVRSSAETGLPVGIHAMGDRAIETSLDAIEHVKVFGTGAAERRTPYRIEHCSLPSQRSLYRMRELGIVPVPQPGFLYAEGEAYRQQLGDRRVARAYPLRTMLELGLRPALSSDAPATSVEDAFNPWLGIVAAVTRKTWAGGELGADERICIPEALAGYTANAAAALGLEHRIGSVHIGKDADLVVFPEDPTGYPIDDLASLQPTLVLRRGRQVLR